MDAIFHKKKNQGLKSKEVAGAIASKQQQPTSVRVLPQLPSSAYQFLSAAKKQWSNHIAFIHLSRFTIKNQGRARYQ